ncbi:MAG: ribosome biogenesis GTPase Der [Rhodospirillales bacterium 12-54-5]|nr:MAG: ribosome biogenesis GTPase Der [Rhodospirillales bacterium 12-54-5]
MSTSSAELPIIAILGRPNVGKSTLFNRLVGKKIALVDDQPGVTRDRRYGDANLAGLQFRIIDTAGMEEAPDEHLQSRMHGQSLAAIEEADVLLFALDARAGVTPPDRIFAQLLRRSGKPVIIVGNKAEGNAGRAFLGDIYALGFDNVVLLSAEHGDGFVDLYEALALHVSDPTVYDDSDRKNTKKKPKVASAKSKAAASKRAPETEAADDELADEEPLPNKLRLVILGRPNAGKSTLVNSMLGQDRLLVGPEAGITRDSIMVDFEHAGVHIELVDTAGMRKRANVQSKLEKLAVADSIRAMVYAEVVVILLDATAPMEKQDAALASLVEREGRACVIGLNKWDLIKGDAKPAFLDEIRYMLDRQLGQMHGITVVPISAIQGKGMEKLLDACIAAREIWNKRVSTATLNRWLEGLISHHTPPLVKGRRLKIKYLTQVKARPPTFHLFCNMAEEFPESYLRYIVGALRESFGLPGTPIRLILKESNNPFEKYKKRINK